MNMKPIFLLFNLLLGFTLASSGFAQADEDPYVYGRILDVYDTPLPGVEVINTFNGKSVFSDERGFYHLTVDEEKFVIIRFEYFDHDAEDRKVFLRKGDIREINPMMRPMELLLLATSGYGDAPPPNMRNLRKPKPKPVPVAPTYGVSTTISTRNPQLPIAKLRSEVLAERAAKQKAAEAAKRAEEAAKAAAKRVEAERQAAIAAAKEKARKEKELAELLALRKQERVKTGQITLLKMLSFNAIPVQELTLKPIPVLKRKLPKVQPIVEPKRPWWQFWKKK